MEQTFELVGGQRLILPLDDLVRFWTSVRKTDTCWLWEATIRKSEGKDKKLKYGNFQFGNTNYLAHRISYAIHNHYTLDCVLHSCDVSLCVNPDHLFEGTRKDNNIDCRQKNRNPSNTILTVDEASEILALKGILTQKEIAIRFKVSVGCVQAIHDGRAWKHL